MKASWRGRTIALLLTGVVAPAWGHANVDHLMISRADQSASVTVLGAKTALWVVQRGTRLTVLCGPVIGVSAADARKLETFGLLKSLHHGLQIDLNPRDRPSWFIIGNRLSLQLPQAPPTQMSSSGNGLVPGLPFPFIAGVEGQVRTLLAARPPQKGETDANPQPVQAVSDVAISRVPRSQSFPVQRRQSSAKSVDVDLGITTEIGVAAEIEDQTLTMFFDRPVPTDLTPVAGFSPVVEQIGGGSLVRLHLAGKSVYRLEATNGTWHLTTSLSPGVRDSAIPVVRTDDDVAFDVGRAGRTLTYLDPKSGSTLLIGTVRQSVRPFQPGVRTALFSVDPTASGVIVRRLSSRLQLTGLPDRFVLSMDRAKAGVWKRDQRSIPSIVMRDLLLGGSSIPAAWRRLDGAIATAGLKPIGERTRARLDVSGAMLALGLVPEAAAVLEIAAAESPAVTADSRFNLYASIVRALDPNAAAYLPSPTTDARGDEPRFWADMTTTTATTSLDDRERHRALLSGIALIPDYLAPLRDLAARRAAYVFSSGPKDDRALIPRLPQTPDVRLAGAEAGVATGNSAAASILLRELCRSADEAIATRSLLDLIEVRAARGEVPPAQAARQLDQHQLDWRLVGRSVEAAQLAIGLHGRAGQLGLAFDGLRALEAAQPVAAAQAAEELASQFDGPASKRFITTTSAAETMSAITENAAWLSTHPGLAHRLEPALAELLAAFGLPELAANTLEQELRLDGNGKSQGERQLRLAELRLDAGQADLADRALAEADRSGVGSVYAERRDLVAAELAAARGNDDEALRLAAGQNTSTASELRALIFERRHDWAAAEATLKPMAAAIGPNGVLTSGESALVLQLAASASHVGDGETISDCAKRFGDRIADRGTRQALLQLSDQERAGASQVPSAAKGA